MSTDKKVNKSGLSISVTKITIEVLVLSDSRTYSGLMGEAVWIGNWMKDLSRLRIKAMDSHSVCR